MTRWPAFFFLWLIYVTNLLTADWLLGNTTLYSSARLIIKCYFISTQHNEHCDITGVIFFYMPVIVYVCAGVFHRRCQCKINIWHSTILWIFFHCLLQASARCSTVVSCILTMIACLLWYPLIPCILLSSLWHVQRSFPYTKCSLSHLCPLIIWQQESSIHSEPLEVSWLSLFSRDIVKTLLTLLFRLR